MKNSPLLVILICLLLTGCSSAPMTEGYYGAITLNKSKVETYLAQGNHIDSKVNMFIRTHSLQMKANNLLSIALTCKHNETNSQNKDRLEFIKWLIEKRNANVNSTGNRLNNMAIASSSTPLYNAGLYCYKFPKIITYLLDKGAVPNIHYHKKVIFSNMPNASHIPDFKKHLFLQSDPTPILLTNILPYINNENISDYQQMIRKLIDLKVTPAYIDNPRKLSQPLAAAYVFINSKKEMDKNIREIITLMLKAGDDPNKLFPALLRGNGEPKSTQEIVAFYEKIKNAVSLSQINSGRKSILQMARESQFNDFANLMIKERKKYLQIAMKEALTRNDIPTYHRYLYSISEHKQRRVLVRKLLSLLQKEKNSSHRILQLVSSFPQDKRYLPARLYIKSMGPKNLTIGKILTLIKEKTPESMISEMILQTNSRYPKYTKEHLNWLKRNRFSNSILLTMEQVTLNTNQREIKERQEKMRQFANQQRQERILKQQQAQVRAQSQSGSSGVSGLLGLIPGVGALANQVQSKVPGSSAFNNINQVTSGKFTSNRSITGVAQNLATSNKIMNSNKQVPAKHSSQRTPAAIAPPSLNGSWTTDGGKGLLTFHKDGTGKYISRDNRYSTETDFNWESTKSRIIFTYKYTIKTDKKGHQSIVKKKMKEKIQKYILTKHKLSIAGVLYRRK